MFEPSLFSAKNRKVIQFTDIKSVRRGADGAVRVESDRRTFQFRSFSDVDTAWEIIGGIHQRHIRSHGGGSGPPSGASSPRAELTAGGGVAAVDNLAVSLGRVSCLQQFFFAFFLNCFQ